MTRLDLTRGHAFASAMLAAAADQPPACSDAAMAEE